MLSLIVFGISLIIGCAAAAALLVPPQSVARAQQSTDGSRINGQSATR